jgi:hypothetical protein
MSDCRVIPAEEPGVEQLLGDHGVVAEVEAQAAVLRRHGRAQDAGLAAGQPELAVDDAVGFPAVEVGHSALS